MQAGEGSRIVDSPYRRRLNDHAVAHLDPSRTDGVRVPTLFVAFDVEDGDAFVVADPSQYPRRFRVRRGRGVDHERPLGALALERAHVFV